MFEYTLNVKSFIITFENVERLKSHSIWLTKLLSFFNVISKKYFHRNSDENL